MSIERLLDQAEEERQLCITFGHDPMDSKRYRSILRQLTVLRENSKPAVRRTKTALVSILAITIPLTLWAWAYIISESIKLIIL